MAIIWDLLDDADPFIDESRWSDNQRQNKSNAPIGGIMQE